MDIHVRAYLHIHAYMHVSQLSSFACLVAVSQLAAGLRLESQRVCSHARAVRSVLQVSTTATA